MRASLIAASTASALMVTSLAFASAAFADDDGDENGLESRGTCSISSLWKSEVEFDDGANELTFEVRGTSPASEWSFVATTDADVVLTSKGLGRTRDRGHDRDKAKWKAIIPADATSVKAVATNPTSGEECTATIELKAPAPTPAPAPTDPVVTDPVSTQDTTSQVTPSTKRISAATVAQHGTASDCWSIVGKNVYDLTSFVSQHPGGPGRIIGICGANGTSAFKSQHMSDRNVAQVLAAYKIGSAKKKR